MVNDLMDEVGITCENIRKLDLLKEKFAAHQDFQEKLDLKTGTT